MNTCLFNLQTSKHSLFILCLTIIQLSLLLKNILKHIIYLYIQLFSVGVQVHISFSVNILIIVTSPQSQI